MKKAGKAKDQQGVANVREAAAKKGPGPARHGDITLKKGYVDISDGGTGPNSSKPGSPAGNLADKSTARVREAAAIKGPDPLKPGSPNDKLSGKSKQQGIGLLVPAVQKVPDPPAKP